MSAEARGKGGRHRPGTALLVFLDAVMASSLSCFLSRANYVPFPEPKIAWALPHTSDYAL